jgi:IclR helix-turn-helix domain
VSPPNRSKNMNLARTEYRQADCISLLMPLGYRSQPSSKDCQSNLRPSSPAARGSGRTTGSHKRIAPAKAKALRTKIRAPHRSPNKVPIRAIVRAMSVLQVLAQRPAGVALVELSQMVGLHKATVFRVVRTLILLGYVEQAASRDIYAISPSQKIVLRKTSEKSIVPP